MGIYGVVLGHPEGILEACWGILEAGLSYNRGFGMKSSDVWARIAVFAGPKANHHYRMDGRFGPTGQSPLHGGRHGTQSLTII